MEMLKKLLNKTNPEIENYFKILSNDIPDFIYEYVDTKEMQRLSGVGYFCGIDYNNKMKDCDLKYFFSRLDHSIAVALIVWNFTKDKKQTLAGLFHDISSPTFSHVVDFMNGDSLKQESTEYLTEEIIKNSKEITSLLKKDNINLEDVIDYQLYPIADNPRPKLSADRLDGIFSSKLIWFKNWELEDIKNVYENIQIFKNEENIDELGFNNLISAQEFGKGIIELGYILQKNENKLALNFLGDILKTGIRNNIFSEEDLFNSTEQEIIFKIKTSQNDSIKKAWDYFENMHEIKRSDILIEDNYCISLDSKKRYIDPLIYNDNNLARITDISNEFKKNLENLKSFEDSRYAYIDFKF